MSKPLILVIEDRKVFSDVVEDALKQAGYRTLWTDATEEAWRIVHEKPVALIVLDADELRPRPTENALRNEGIRFLKRLREDADFSKKRLPVIGTSFHIQEGAGSWETAFVNAGGNAFFEQRVDLMDLVSIVSELLGEASGEKS